MARIVTHHRILIGITVVCAFFVPFSVAHGQVDYTPLTGIPGITEGNLGLGNYINALFFLSITVGAMLAVIKITIGGFRYMTAGDMQSARTAAKQDIGGALLGLGILLSTVLVLTTIYPGLVNLNFLRSAVPIVLPEPPEPPDPVAECTFAVVGTPGRDAFLACQAQCLSQGMELRQPASGNVWECVDPTDPSEDGYWEQNFSNYSPSDVEELERGCVDEDGGELAESNLLCELKSECEDEDGGNFSFIVLGRGEARATCSNIPTEE